MMPTLILFTLFGLSADQTGYLIIGLAVLGVYLLTNPSFFSRFQIQGRKRHTPRNCYIMHNGYPRQVAYYDENELACVDRNRGIWDATAIVYFKEGGRLPVTLRQVEPSSWEAVDGGFQDKRIWAIRRLTADEAHNEEILLELSQTLTYLNTLREAYRKSQTWPQQFEEQAAEHSERLRKLLAPQITFRPGMPGSQGRPGGGFGAMLEGGQQQGEVK